jgi:hypothetical protein
MAGIAIDPIDLCSCACPVAVDTVSAIDPIERTTCVRKVTGSHVAIGVAGILNVYRHFGPMR